MAKNEAEVKRPAHRPRKEGARLYSVRLTEAVAEYYRTIGNGNLTLGIERVATESSYGQDDSKAKQTLR